MEPRGVQALKLVRFKVGREYTGALHNAGTRDGASNPLACGRYQSPFISRASSLASSLPV